MRTAAKRRRAARAVRAAALVAGASCAVGGLVPAAEAAQCAPDGCITLTNSVPPRISGEARVGGKLTASSGTWGPEPGIWFSYRWYRCPAASTLNDPSWRQFCTRVPDGLVQYPLPRPGNEYHPDLLDVGRKLRVEVEAWSYNTDPGVGGPVPSSNYSQLVCVGAATVCTTGP